MLVDSSESMHETVEGLADEIASEILMQGSMEQSALREEFNRVKQTTSRERNPDVAYATVLFRKFAALQYKEAATDGGPPGTFAWLTETLSRDTNSWILRCVTALFALLAFAVMSSTPYIENRIFKPNHHFHVSLAHYSSVACVLLRSK
jgi:hypothetical protein